MGLDGFSMGNLGLNTELTPAQLVTQAELSAQKESEFKIKNISESEKEQRIKRKEDDEGNKNQNFEDNFEKDDETDTSEDFSPTHIDEKDIENSNPKDFAVRINPQTEQIELFSKKEERVLETIAAKDLMGLVTKLDGASGILVNRKI